MSIIGICGNARSGKDTLADLISEALSDIGVKCRKIALADSLKEECEDLVLNNLGIDVFTQDSREKSIIRPLLVTWGTHVRRKVNPDVWIEKLSDKISENEVTIIPDIRYKNEFEWLRSLNSYCLFVDRIDADGNPILPANDEEENNNPFLRKNSDFQLTWATVGDDQISSLKSVAVEVLEKTISQEVIGSWTKTFC